MRIHSIGMAYKPHLVRMKRQTLRQFVALHKRMVRHAAKQYLKTGHQRDLDRMMRKLTDWDFE